MDDYIGAQSEAVQPMLRELRATIKAALPEAEERIAYNMPAYRVGGRNVAYFGAAKKHCALYGIVRDGFEEELVPYGDVSKGTMRLPLGEPVPVDLIRRLVRARAAKSSAKPAAKAKAAR